MVWLSFFLNIPKVVTSEVHAEPLEDAPHDHDFVRKLLRRPAREDCRHEAAQKMPRSILQQPSFTKFLLFWFSLLFSLSNANYLHFTCGCGVEGKFIKIDLSAKKSHSLKS